MNKPVKMAIVGAGLWGEAHASLYMEHPDAEPVAICDIDKSKAETFAKKFGLNEFYTDHNVMLSECDCDAVAVVTPDHLHADISIAAAAAKKHMIIEKPLATTREETLRMVDAIEGNGVRAMVDLHNRWNPPFNAVKQLVQSGKYGTPTNAHFRMTDNLWVATDMLRGWVTKSSILWFLGSHSLDTMNWIIDDYPVEVYSIKTEGKLKSMGIDTADTYMTTIRYNKGAVAQMENSWATPNGNPCVNDFKFYLLCTDGKFDVDASSHGLLWVSDQERMFSQDILVKNRVFDKYRGFAYESIRSFIDKLVSGEEFHVTLRESANISLAICAMLESAETDKRVKVERI